MNSIQSYDVIIVGGGPAGLSAALLLGRSRRSVVLFDTGHPRNAQSQGMHGYLTRDGILPPHFLSLGRAELREYGIDFVPEEVVRACKDSSGFFAFTAAGRSYRARKFLIATGLIDRLPSIDGMSEYFGRGIYHCPYCDGWEVRDGRIAIMGRRRAALELSLALRHWSGDVTLLTNGNSRYSETERTLLERHGVRTHDGIVARVDGKQGKVTGILFKDGSAFPCRALFISYGYQQHSDLATQLGCAFTKKGVVRTDRYQETSTNGVYVVGDAARDMQMVVVAAAEGAKAGVAINKALLGEEL